MEFRPITVRAIFRLFLILWTASFLNICDLRAAVFDFSMPLQSIIANVSTGAVALSVFDPSQGKDMGTNITCFRPDNLTIQDGVVMWRDAFNTFYYVYDPYLTNWVGSSSSSFFDNNRAIPRITKGMGRWVSGTTISAVVYDRTRSRWSRNVTDFQSPTLFTLSSSDGVVFWATSTRIGYLTYDPGDGAWKTGFKLWSVSDFVPPLYNTNGIVAWAHTNDVGGGAWAATYDPNRRAWTETLTSPQMVSQLYSEDGIVVWMERPAVYFTIYDPLRRSWQTGTGTVLSSASFIISNATMHWRNASGTWVASGYNPATGTWQPNIETKPLAFFSVSPTNGNSPFGVYFADMSIGATSWSWNFDDGSPQSTSRSPFHRYLNFARHRPALTVTSASGQVSSTNGLIKSDALPPTGKMLVNGGDAWTANTAVTLHLLAADNSGIVASNRFSNNNTNWSVWEEFSTNKLWTLTPGYEPKSAFAQVTDESGNTATFTDSILYHTNPPPLATFIITNVPERQGLITFQIQLSRTSAWPVNVTYIVTNGTATVGSDYTGTPSPVVFPPGATVQNVQRIGVLQDSIVEPDETILFIFDNLDNAIAGPSATLTILDNDTPLLLMSSRVGQNAQFQMTITSALGRSVTIQASESLVDWTSLITLTNTTGSVEFVDPSLSVSPFRFYRAVLSP